jgi:ribokinase
VSSIVVLGSANMDLVVRQPRLPEPGETIFGASYSVVPGGKGLNQAVAAARAGGTVAFLGAVGVDAFGAQLRATLIADGIDVTRLAETDVETGTAHIAVVDGGENSIVVVPGANAAVATLADGDVAAIAAASYLVAQLERPLGLVAEALRLARRHGVTTVLTPAPVQSLPDGLLEHVDILVPNTIEARQLSGLDDATAAALALSARRTVVLTRGGDGVLVARDGVILHDLPARRVEPVDTTGAGDTFTGVLVARLSLGDDLPAALAAANVGASISVTRAGATTSMPAWAEIAAALP